MRSFAHIISPTIAPATSDLFVAQPITFETMRLAQDYAARTGQIKVSLYAAQFAEDSSFLPSGFIATPALERSTLEFGPFQLPRKLPLLADILDRLYAAAPDADYLIYTNTDIGLLPSFYITVDRLIEGGHEAFTINRRTIGTNYHDVADIPLMWADPGEPHPGADCFVFPRSIAPRFTLGDVCLGANHVGRQFVLNLILHARNYSELTGLHLTFHIGNDQIWLNPALADYAAHNLVSLRKVLYSLKTGGRLPDHPVFARMINALKGAGDLEMDF